MNGMLNYLLKCKIVNYLAQLLFIVFKSILQKVRDVF